MGYELIPKVGLGILIFRDGKILFGKRKGSHGEGYYSGSGGHLEHMESFEDCLRREVREETGMEITNVRFLCVVNLQAFAPKHYIDLGFTADWVSGEAQVLEPDKCEHWGWYPPEALPSPLFPSIHSYLEALKTGRTHFDA